MKKIIIFCKDHPRLFAGLFWIIFWISWTILIWSILAPTWTNPYILLFLQYLLWFLIVFTITHILSINKWLSLLGFLWWIIIDIILSNRKKKQTLTELQKTWYKAPSSAIQFLWIFLVIWFAIYGSTTNAIGWIISFWVLIFIFWYTKKK